MYFKILINLHVNELRFDCNKLFFISILRFFNFSSITLFINLKTFHNNDKINKQDQNF